MAVTLYHVGRRPGQSQFGLDSFTESYKANDPAGTVMTDGSVPQKGDAHGSYAGMFVTDRYCTETGPSSSALEIVYTGIFSDLPPAQNESDNAVLSATGQVLAGGASLTEPATVQYYAPTNIKTFITAGGPATSGFADDPTADCVVITYTVGTASFLPGGAINAIIAMLFTSQVVHTLRSTEIVAGQYWQNSSQKTKTLVPYAVDLGSGAVIQLASAGLNYVAGDTLGISAGGESATIDVLSVGSVFGGGGGIMSYSVSANTFTVAHSGLTGTGGTGTGASFNVLVF